MSVISDLKDKIDLVSTNPMLDKALLLSNYILRVKFDNIVNKVDPKSYEGNSISFVQCTILDTIKGKIAPSCY